MARKPDPAAALRAAQVALQAIQTATAEINSRRDAALLAGEPAAAIRALDQELDTQQHAERTEGDRIRLLEAEVERLRVERQVREKAGLIGRIEAKFKARNEAAAELQDAIRTADKAFRKIIDLSVECDAAWPFAAHERTAAMIPATSIQLAVQHELFRVGARPRRYGGMDKGVHPGLHFPGGQCPRLEWVNLPEQIPSFTDAMRDAANFASAVMRTGRAAPPATMVTAPADATTPAPAPRTEAQERLDQLLQRQMKLSANPADEAEYLTVVAEIATVSAEVDAQAKGAAA
jgi:hypothetical protein